MDAGSVDLDAALQVAVDAAKKAGTLVLDGFHSKKTVKTKTAFFDLVTEYDRKSEDIITSEIKKTFPTHRFIGEETATKVVTLTNEPSWIIDPIDGTVNYVHGFPQSCISIALAINKDVKVGVVYNPMKDMLLTAIKGKGCYENGKRIYVSKCTDIQNTVIAIEFLWLDMKRWQGLAQCHGMRALGSAAKTLCYMANGTFDAYLQDGLNCWDVAAGALLVQEAGGVVVSSTGEPFDVMAKKMLVASSQPLADTLLKIIKEADRT